MISASGHPLPILGAALIRLELKNSGRSTRQMIYFSTKATKLYLSLATCIDLGLIGSQFSLGIPPPPDQTQPIHQVHDDHSKRRPVPKPSPPPSPGDSLTPTSGPHTPPAPRRTTPQPGRPCSCPQRAPPPEMPTLLPFPGTEENRHRLERYLLDHYAASAFNVCEHQPLPMMSGPPLSLTIDPKAIPKPCHTPITIPVHWQDRLRQRCQTRHSGEGPPGHARHLVPPHGDMHQEGRVAQADHQFSTIKPARHQRDTPLPLSLPPSPSHSTPHQEDRIRCVEWLSLSRLGRTRPSLYHIYHPLGEI